MSVWRLSGFEELHELGSGAQGRVVLARRAGTGEMVAIKYLAPELLGDPRHRAMFRDEVNMLVRVADPHVARLYEYVETPEGAAIVMEAVNGVSLREVLGHGPMAPEAALVVLKGSLLGLAAAHAVRVVHRDYKPANVLVEGNGNSKLIDFGIAGLSGEGTVAGTPAYMAPEQWRGAPVSPAADVYSATCVFFECVTGGPPYASGDTTTLRRMHEAAPLPTQAVPEPLRPLVAHGLAKDPAHRLPGAHQFVTLLERLATGAYGPDWERRGWIALGAATAVLAAAFPAAALGMTTGATGLAHGAAHLAGKVGAKGLFGKATGLKVGGGLVATAVAATTVYLVWPAPQHVGGTTSGALHMYLNQPGKIGPYRNPTVADSPILDYTFTVSPANVRSGTKVSVTSRWVSLVPNTPDKRKTAPTCYDRRKARLTGDVDYKVSSGDLIKGDYKNVYLYPDAGTGRLPTTKPFVVPISYSPAKVVSSYDSTRCLDVDTSTDTLTFTVPKTLSSGTYLVSPIGRPRITQIRTGPKLDTPVDPETAGAQAEGRLPKLTIF
jgi:Protein kinase domain